MQPWFYPVVKYCFNAICFTRFIFVNSVIVSSNISCNDLSWNFIVMYVWYFVSWNSISVQGAIWPSLSPCTVINPILLTYLLPLILFWDVIHSFHWKPSFWWSWWDIAVGTVSWMSIPLLCQQKAKIFISVHYDIANSHRIYKFRNFNAEWVQILPPPPPPPHEKTKQKQPWNKLYNTKLILEFWTNKLTRFHHPSPVIFRLVYTYTVFLQFHWYLNSYFFLYYSMLYSHVLIVMIVSL